ncbi:hypothetical protein [Plasmodium yoelii yoelii]|uniref:Uncharacterized protein n=1 Tax=Plasmodium yoelii yoelii TaxID=73239 RepID=Q7RPG2_PLAYO|nr:hypothetical protein [Plasmodium yoelii yoelii]
MNDINNFNNLLLLNKKLAHTNYMCINSMINNDSNFLLLNLKKKYISSFKIPIDIFVLQLPLLDCFFHFLHFLHLL